jgi:hypothetical protein
MQQATSLQQQEVNNALWKTVKKWNAWNDRNFINCGYAFYLYVLVSQNNWTNRYDTKTPI